ncbi:MAG: hypothetical protein IJ905_00705, partial [Fibrobacter sp.]|nr:hypothetical protein [Fibrobacter sp.]
MKKHIYTLTAVALSFFWQACSEDATSANEQVKSSASTVLVSEAEDASSSASIGKDKDDSSLPNYSR